MSIFTTNDGTEIFYRDQGEGEPVVLIHGWPLSGDMWENQTLALLESGYRVITYDRRGFGRSGHAGRGYDYDTMADDLHGLLTILGIEKTTLVGFSMGGGEVARYLSRHGTSRVLRVALISSVVPGILHSEHNPGGVPSETLDKIQDGLREDRHKFFAGFSRDFFGNTLLTSAVSAEVLAWATQMANQASLKAEIDCVDAFGRTDFRADLAAFTVPTLVIHGNADKTVPIAASVERVSELVPEAALRVYEGAPHGLFVTHKDLLNADLLDFLETSRAQRGTVAA